VLVDLHRQLDKVVQNFVTKLSSGSRLKPLPLKNKSMTKSKIPQSGLIMVSRERTGPLTVNNLRLLNSVSTTQDSSSSPKAFRYGTVISFSATSEVSYAILVSIYELAVVPLNSRTDTILTIRKCHKN